MNKINIIYEPQSFCPLSSKYNEIFYDVYVYKFNNIVLFRVMLIGDLTIFLSNWEIHVGEEYIYFLISKKNIRIERSDLLKHFTKEYGLWNFVRANKGCTRFDFFNGKLTLKGAITEMLQ